MDHNDRILTLALEALRAERQKLDDEIADIERQLGKGQRETKTSVRGRRSSRRMSAAGRKAISDAMTKRWVQYRQRKGQGKRV